MATSTEYASNLTSHELTPQLEEALKQKKFHDVVSLVLAGSTYGALFIHPWLALGLGAITVWQAEKRNQSHNRVDQLQIKKP